MKSLSPDSDLGVNAGEACWLPVAEVGVLGCDNGG
jgi:hypothetical protein